MPEGNTVKYGIIAGICIVIVITGVIAFVAVKKKKDKKEGQNIKAEEGIHNVQEKRLWLYILALFSPQYYFIFVFLKIKVQLITCFNNIFKLLEDGYDCAYAEDGSINFNNIPTNPQIDDTSNSPDFTQGAEIDLTNHTTIQTIQNPYYGADDDFDADIDWKNDAPIWQVVDNGYYEWIFAFLSVIGNLLGMIGNS